MTPGGVSRLPLPLAEGVSFVTLLPSFQLFQSSVFAMPHPTRPGQNRRSAENFDSWWYLKFWAGINLFAWIRLLIRNRLAVHWKCLPTFLFLCGSGALNTILRFVQYSMWRSRIHSVEIRAYPIFIVGHWRSGTTFLHELMALDERHTYPTTYECFSPNHFLLTQK